MLPFYILHQTVLVTVGYIVVGWAIPDLLKFLSILCVSLFAVMALYEFVVRRHNLLRFLFGMKLAVRPTAVQPQEPLVIEPARML